MYKPTPEENKREQIVEMLRDILSDEYVCLVLKKLSIKENNESKPTEVSYSFLESGKSRSVSKAIGSGILDCIFSSLLKKYSNYSSLSTVKLVEFDVITDFKKINIDGTAASITVSAKFKSEQQENYTEFRKSGNSIVMALSKCAFSVVEYYLNCELAFRKLKYLISEANSRGRSDVAQKYVSKISKIVNCSIASFEKVSNE